MPRQLRREYAGAIYHVMNRGIAGKKSFVMRLIAGCFWRR